MRHCLNGHCVGSCLCMVGGCHCSCDGCLAGAKPKTTEEN